MCPHKLSTMIKERPVWSTVEFGMEAVALELNLDQRDSFHQPPRSKEQIGSAEIGHGCAEVSHGRAQGFCGRIWNLSTKEEERSARLVQDRPYDYICRFGLSSLCIPIKYRIEIYNIRCIKPIRSSIRFWFS